MTAPTASPRSLPLVLAMTLLGGCIGVKARVASGPTVDTGGSVGYQATASVGFGYATKKSGIMGRLGASTSDRAGVALSADYDYTRVGKTLVSSLGLGYEVGLTSETGAVWVGGAALAPLRYRSRRDPGHPKIGFGGTTRSALSAGLEARGGVAFGTEVDTVGLMTVMAALEWTVLSTVDI